MSNKELKERYNEFIEEMTREGWGAPYSTGEYTIEDFKEDIKRS